MSFRILSLILAVAACATFPRQAAAQSGQLGLSIGYPASLGVLWQPSALVGIRPEFTFDLFNAESTSVSQLGTARFSTDNRLVGVGLSTLFRVYREENLSLYVSPRYVHRRGKTTVVQDVPANVFVGGNDDRKIRGHSISGSLGARYELGARFAVFGELGVDHSREDTTDPATESRITRTGIRSGVGVVLYLF
jgi:hypothetical protein